MKIDIFFLAYNRLDFTKRSLAALVDNTNWQIVNRLVIYDDGSTDGTREYLHLSGVCVDARHTQGLGPVGIMNDLIARGGADVFAKIDNDVMLPPGWLNESLEVFERERADLLGIEAMHPCGPGPRRMEPAEYIGGIGLMRRSAFNRPLMQPHGRFGFTAWQCENTDLRKGWLNPSLPVCLLNLVPFEPWSGLSREYKAKGWQRSWPGPYPQERSDLWRWWSPENS